MEKKNGVENAVELSSATTELTESKGKKIKKQESKLRKTLRIIKNVLCWGVLAILVLTVVVFMSSKVNGKAPTFFGYSILRVSTGSMEPELMIGDVILGKSVDNPNLVTHKVITAPHKTEDGTYKLQTKGVANDAPDPEISTDDVRYIMVCKLGFIDTLYNIFLSPWGLLIFIAVLLLIFVDEIVVIIRILTGHDKTAKDGDINEIIDRLQREKQEENSADNSQSDK